MSRVLTHEENIGIAAARHHGLRELLDDFGLDYYCEAGHSLEEAVAEAGVNLRDVRSRIEHLSAADAGPNWPDEPLSALVEHLEMDEHGMARTLMFRAALLFGDVCHSGGDSRLADMRTTFRDVSTALVVHMEHEEHTIFPAIASLEEAWIKGEEPPPLAEGGIRAAAARFRQEHADIARELRKLRRERLAIEMNSAPIVRLFDDLELFERCIHEAMNLEDSVAFPRGIALQEALFRSMPAVTPA
jgi:iron-sulfur cluster repair protein YtfE (RIC family)